MNRIICLLLCVCLTANAFPAFRGGPSGGDAVSSVTVILTLARGCSAPVITDPNAVITYSDDSFIILDHTGTNKELTAFIGSMQIDPAVLFAETDSKCGLTAESITNDYFSASQYWLNNTGSYSRFSSSGISDVTSTADIDIDAPAGWESFRLQKPEGSVIVAVIDTGIDIKHPELSEVIWTNEGEIPGNGIDDDGNGYIDDINGWDFYNDDASVCHYEYSAEHDAYLASPKDNDNHGTHCTGIIAAKANNGVGIAGVASVGNIRLLPLKVYGGSDCSGSVADAIKAIRYADRAGAKVCNISWGFYNYSASLFSAISRSNMLFICAAGNDGADNDSKPLYPASYDLDNVISVGYLDENGHMASGSNYGSSTVDVAVPAMGVFSTTVGTYASMNGSSMAAPQVTGIAALLYCFGDGIYAANVRDIILGSTMPVDGLDASTVTGGIPKLSLAMNAVSEIVKDLEPPELHLTLSYFGENLILDFTTSDSGGSSIGGLRFFSGKKSVSYFAHGAAGTAIADNELTLTRAGKYTFFVNDRAGNETARTIMIPDDILGPEIDDVRMTPNKKGTKLTVSVRVADRHSGLESVRYMKGYRLAADFAGHAGEELTPDQNSTVSFSAGEGGTYTLFASDNRGNISVSHIYAYIRKAVSVALSKSSLELEPAQTKRLKARTVPSVTTDRIAFASSDTSVAEVSSDGTVTAIAPGRCVITVSTSRGKTADCTVVVNEPAGE